MKRYQVYPNIIARKRFMVSFCNVWPEEQHIISWPKSDQRKRSKFDVKTKWPPLLKSVSSLFLSFLSLHTVNLNYMYQKRYVSEAIIPCYLDVIL